MLSCSIISVNNNGFSSFVPAFGQGQSINSTSSSSFKSQAAIIDNMPSQKVTVGDIDIAYKKLGISSSSSSNSNAKPIILIMGRGGTMDLWNPILIEQLVSSNYTVIIFDNRGAGQSTANDTAGLLEALEIDKA
jgi:pimeloyl-ACP methyl ester carboxylesterase